MAILYGMLIATMSPLLLMLSLIGLVKSPRQWRIFSAGYVVCIAMIAYSWVPQSTPDITRYFSMLDKCSSLTLLEVNDYFNDGLFVKNFVFWIIGHLGDVHLLPAISTGTVYGIASYITCSCSEKENKTRYIPIIMLVQFLSLPFFSITSNIRNVLCFALIMLAAYRELYQGKKNIITLILYILPCFIHSGGWILIGIRLISMLAKSFRWIAVVVAFGVPWVINFFHKRIALIPNQSLVRMIRTAYAYLNETDSVYARSVASNIGEILSRDMAMLMAVIIVGYIYLHMKWSKEKNLYLAFEFLVGSAVIGFNAFTVPHYWRLAVALMIGIAPVLLLTIDKFRAKRYLYKSILGTIFLVSILQFYLQLKTTRGLVDYKQLLSDIVLNNIYVVFFKIVKGIIFWT